MVAIIFLNEKNNSFPSAFLSFFRTFAKNLPDNNN